MINNSPDGILAHLSEVILHSNHHLIVRRPDWISWGKPTDAPPKDFSLPMVRRVPRLGISDLAEFQNSPYTKQWVVNTNAFPSSEMWKTCRFKVWIWMKKMETWKVANVWDWENGENNYKASKISGKTIQPSRLFPPNPILVRRRSENKVQQFVEVLETSTERDGNPSIKTQKSTCFHERNFTRFTKQILPALKPATRSPGLTGTLSSDDGLFIPEIKPIPSWVYLPTFGGFL